VAQQAMLGGVILDILARAVYYCPRCPGVTRADSPILVDTKRRKRWLTVGLRSYGHFFEQLPNPVGKKHARADAGALLNVFAQLLVSDHSVVSLSGGDEFLVGQRNPGRKRILENNARSVGYSVRSRKV